MGKKKALTKLKKECSKAYIRPFFFIVFFADETLPKVQKITIHKDQVLS